MLLPLVATTEAGADFFFLLLMLFLFFTQFFLWKKKSSIPKLFCFYFWNMCVSLYFFFFTDNPPNERKRMNEFSIQTRESDRKIQPNIQTDLAIVFFFTCAHTCDFFSVLNSNTQQFRCFVCVCGICTIFANKQNDNSV